MPSLNSRVLLGLLTSLSITASAFGLTPTGRTSTSSTSSLSYSLTTTKTLQTTTTLQSSVDTTTTKSIYDGTATLTNSTTGLTGFGIGGGSDNVAQFSSNVTLQLSTSQISVAPGTSNTDLYVTVNRHASVGQVFLYSEGEPDTIDLIELDGPLVNAGQSYRIDVAASAQPGSYQVQIKAFFYDNGDAYSAPANLTINVTDATSTTPESEFAVVEFSYLPIGSVDRSMYNAGVAYVDSMFGVYDTNGDNVVDGYGGNSWVVYPAFSDGTGGLDAGARFAYSNTYGQADIVVAARLNGDNNQWAVLHINHESVDGIDVFEPVLLMVVNYNTQELMLQDVSGWTYDIDGTLPTSTSSGSIYGTLEYATPFGIDPTAQPVFETYGNGVDFSFNVTLQNE